MGKLTVAFEFYSVEEALDFLNKTSSPPTGNQQGATGSRFASTAPTPKTPTSEQRAARDLERQAGESEAGRLQREASSAVGKITAAAQRIMDQNPDVDWSGLKGSGKKGNVLKSDAKKYLEKMQAGSDPNDKPEGPRRTRFDEEREAPPDEELQNRFVELFKGLKKALDSDDVARARCRELVRYFGAAKVSAIPLKERKLFLRYCDAMQDNPAVAVSDLPKTWAEGASNEVKESDTEPETGDLLEEESSDEGAPEDEAGATLQDVRDALEHLSNERGLEPCMHLLSEFDVMRVDELPEKRYAHFVRRANERAKES